MYIKVYLSEQEKKQLEEIADRKKLSVSKLCYEQLAPLLSAPLTIPDNGKEEPAQMKFNNRVPVYFSEKEYQALLSDAKGISLSSYVRKEFLSRRGPIKISVYTDDISALTLKVSRYIDQLNNFIAALAIRRQLYDADYVHLIQIADDTRAALRDAATYAKANRNSIRASGIRILRKEIKKAVAKLQGGDDV